MSEHDLGQLEQLVGVIDRGSDRLRDHMREFEGWISDEGEIIEGVRFRYETLVAEKAEEIFEGYEQEGKRPPSESVRETRAKRIIEREQPALAQRYRALAGSIEIGQRWLAQKRAALSGLQSLNKTERELSGARP